MRTGIQEISPTAAALLADPSNGLFLSMASVWEIAIKVGIGKLALSCNIADYMTKAINGYGFSVLPLTLEDCAEYAALPFPSREHRDPFDRFIITHAKRVSATIVGND